jgi:hypothetical protein
MMNRNHRNGSRRAAFVGPRPQHLSDLIHRTRSLEEQRAADGGQIFSGFIVMRFVADLWQKRRQMRNSPLSVEQKRYAETCISADDIALFCIACAVQQSGFDSRPGQSKHSTPPPQNSRATRHRPMEPNKSTLQKVQPILALDHIDMVGAIEHP